ncbi:hypothetical protein JL722_8860 [Aureococcus anophagefferens]|nr:hypothetical protein JL722_8860 [Aureococcus anophagefferens]
MSGSDGRRRSGLKKEKGVRLSNIMAAKAIADAIRTSLGPRGMDKMIQKGDGEVDAVATCLSSKVIAQNSDAARSPSRVLESSTPRRPRPSTSTASRSSSRPGVANAKIGLIQFCLSAPKTDMENSVVVSDYAAMDRLLREERKHVAHVDSLEAATLGAADLVHEVSMPGSSQKVVKVTGVARAGRARVVRSLVKEKFLVAGGGSAEVEASLGLADAAAREPGPVGFCLRAFADALEVVPYTLAENAGLNPIDVVTSLPGQHKRATFPTSKAPFSAVFHSSLRKRHRGGEADAGIGVKRRHRRMRARRRPACSSTPPLGLATECICMILKIDDLVLVR